MNNEIAVNDHVHLLHGKWKTREKKNSDEKWKIIWLAQERSASINLATGQTKRKHCHLVFGFRTNGFLAQSVVVFGTISSIAMHNGMKKIALYEDFH